MSTPKELTRDELLQRIRGWLHRRPVEMTGARKPRRELPQRVTLKQLDEWPTAELRKFVQLLPAFEAFDKCKDASGPTIPPQHRAFAQHLRQRQGTHLPDFDTFHRERDELERRLLGE